MKRFNGSIIGEKEEGKESITERNWPRSIVKTNFGNDDVRRRFSELAADVIIIWETWHDDDPLLRRRWSK